MYAGRQQELLLLKNGGPGVARNVEGTVYWDNDGTRTSFRVAQIYVGSIAPGDTSMRASRSAASAGWAGADGYVKYEDLEGEEWATRFTFRIGEGNQLVGSHEQPILLRDLGDVAQYYPPR